MTAPATAERVGRWGLTFSGRQFWPRDPRPSDVEIEDIAHALANVCRFGGMVRRFYSVAQHSVIVSELCDDENGAGTRSTLPLIALLHDATEAYLGDVIRPLKRELVGYRALEEAWALAIGRAFLLDAALVHLPSDVKRADRIVCSTEHRDLMSPAGPKWDEVAPLPLTIHPWPPDLAEQRFLDRFRLLTETP